MNVLRNMPIDQVSQLLLDAPDLSIPADLLTKVQQWRHQNSPSNNRKDVVDYDDSESSSSSSSSSDSDDFDNDAAGTAGKRKKRDHQHQGNKSQLTELWQPTKR